MDLSNSIVKTPEAETETPTRIQPVKLSPFSNGVLKRHAPLHRQHHSHHHIVVSYKECLKNHAASLGGHAVDGCGEFMPSSTSDHADRTAFKCAACGCHRNFHRRDPEEPPLLLPNAIPALEFHPHHRHHPPPPLRGNSGSSPNNSPSPPPISSSYYPSAPHVLLALSHVLSSAPPDNNTPISTKVDTTSTDLSNSSSRKRFRTRFTQDQKEKMLEFADRFGWKMQKRDEDAISEFCSEIGVDKGVFKVWMHNNKNAFGKKYHNLTLSNNNTAVSTPPEATTTNGNGINYSDIGSPSAAHYHHQDNNNISNQNVHGQEMNQHNLQD